MIVFEKALTEYFYSQLQFIKFSQITKQWSFENILSDMKKHVHKT